MVKPSSFDDNRLAILATGQATVLQALNQVVVEVGNLM
jgi:hypothetical protein